MDVELTYFADVVPCVRSAIRHEPMAIGEIARHISQSERIVRAAVEYLRAGAEVVVHGEGVYATSRLE